MQTTPTLPVGPSLKAVDIPEPDTIRYIPMDCGQHWGPWGGRCAKCGYMNTDKYRGWYFRTHQYGGTPWIAVLIPQ